MREAARPRAPRLLAMGSDSDNGGAIFFVAAAAPADDAGTGAAAEDNAPPADACKRACKAPGAPRQTKELPARELDGACARALPHDVSFC